MCIWEQYKESANSFHVGVLIDPGLNQIGANLGALHNNDKHSFAAVDVTDVGRGLITYYLHTNLCNYSLTPGYHGWFISQDRYRHLR